MKKTLALILACLTALALLAGCSSEKTDAPQEAADISLRINTEGLGQFLFTEEGQETEGPSASAQLNMFGKATYVLEAVETDAEWAFEKWTKDGEDYSVDRQITVNVTESAEYIAVFEFVPGESSEEGSGESSDDGQNPVMDYVGEYQSGRAHALVEARGADGYVITIAWGDSAWSLAEWVIEGNVDVNTMTSRYSNAAKTYVTYDEEGAWESAELLSDECSGSIAFNADGTFTWHDDQSEYEEDMVFEWLPTEEAGE